MPGKTKLTKKKKKKTTILIHEQGVVLMEIVNFELT